MPREKRKNRKAETQKVSSSQGSNDEATEKEVWDVVKVINPKECDKTTCRLDGCKQTAVTVWAASSNPEDTWPVCEKCQLSEFGGWPEGVEPPEDDDTEQAGSNDEHEKRDTRKGKRAKPSVSPENAADDKAAGTEKETTPEEEEGEEAWRLVQILSKNVVAGRSHTKCMTENCALRAACVYVSADAPKKKWYTCLDCQVRKQPGVLIRKYSNYTS